MRLHEHLAGSQGCPDFCVCQLLPACWGSPEVPHPAHLQHPLRIKKIRQTRSTASAAQVAEAEKNKEGRRNGLKKGRKHLLAARDAGEGLMEITALCFRGMPWQESVPGPCRRC